MYIVHVTSELAPIAKVGGLADVVYGLSQELVKRGHRVEVILPKYDCIDYNLLKDVKVETRQLWSYENHQQYNNTIWSAKFDGLNILLLEPHHPLFYFTRGSIYGCADDNDRFCYFSRACMEYLYKTGREADILHVHDWPTALIPVLLKDMYRPLGMKAGGSVLTIHNLDYQGKCAVHNLTKVGLRGENYMTSDEMQDPSYPGTLNILKGGIKYADAITTVSPTYEKEIKTAEEGRGLHQWLIKHQKKMVGILNGIDVDFWNPAKDRYLTKQYSNKDSIESILQAKMENRKQLSQRLLLQENSCPLVVSISRLVPQKGPQLIEYALKHTLEKGYQFVLLGSSQIPEIALHFERLKQQYSKNRNIAFCLEHDEALAHLIFAAADMIVIPSLFEPCGLTQMIALRYGTIPVVRYTGGLADTVYDVDISQEPEEKRNGFVFEPATHSGIEWALDRAFALWNQKAEKWQKILLNAMNTDVSWSKSANQYLKVYDKILSNPQNSRITSSPKK